jgi:hypothetical protein
MLMAADGYQPFHAWLHGGKIPHNDDCAAATIHHGKLDTPAAIASVSLTPAVIVDCVLTPSPVPRSVDYLLPSSRAPPGDFF